jgi:hypothetical protein
MTLTAARFIDKARCLVATGRVAETGGLYRGEIDLAPMPVPLRQTFAHYEEIVNNQTFSLLDEIEDEVTRMGIKVAIGDQAEAAVEDLQIYPTSGRVSFRLADKELLRTSQSQDQAAKVVVRDDRLVS